MKYMGLLEVDKNLTKFLTVYASFLAYFRFLLLNFDQFTILL